LLSSDLYFILFNAADVAPFSAANIPTSPHEIASNASLLNVTEVEYIGVENIFYSWNRLSVGIRELNY
jgi:hypothetical protein